jgi:hypothetical protein
MNESFNMENRNRILWTSLLAASLPVSTAWASISSDMPPSKSAGPITYVSGSSDPAQAKAMSSEAASYPLELVFFWGRGQKETPVTVDWSIKDAAGHEMLDAPSSGPEVLASLPDGRYTVTARYKETTLSRVLAVHKGIHDTVVLEWPS